MIPKPLKENIEEFVTPRCNKMIKSYYISTKNVNKYFDKLMKSLSSYLTKKEVRECFNLVEN